MNNNHISAKLERLAYLISGYGSLAVAFSGGVDSTFLLAVSKDILNDKVQAIVAKSPVFSEYEERTALDYVGREGILCHVIEPQLMAVTGFVENKKDRCYHCKRALFGMMVQKMETLGLSVLAHGVNVDDLTDYRPGLKAAEELGVKSPLAEAGFTKNEIRYASLIMGLDTADKPQMACLATRIPYGTPVTLEKLSMIEKAEDLLRNMGCGIWRVRHHGDVARIEVSENDFQRFLDKDLRQQVIDRFKELGFLHVALDLEGFSSGSMNRGI
jgi:uncharacterized protein